ncbi:hypothetical protein Tco_1419261, partial [Tanacetum coccineum]
ILAGADNRPPMLDKSMYESWKRRMELYIQVSKEIWDKVKLLMQGTSLSKKELQVNTKFQNSLPPEWSKFVTSVKLARDLHTSNYDKLYAYIEQHEAHANEARLMRKRFPDPLALVANYHQPPSYFNNYHSQYTTPQYQQ